MDYEKTQKTLAPLLAPASALYSAAMRLRAKAYAGGIFASQKPESFCVAVGNISWGGSGKTPLTDWLLTWAEAQGLTPAVLSRGYGGHSETRPLAVTPTTSPDKSGDEPLMLARKHPTAHILADPSRRRALDWLKAHTKTDFIVLDDAMQHLAVKRDLNLVLLRARDLGEEWGKVIPAGSWREGPKALERADAFMLRATPQEVPGLEPLARRRLAPLGKPVFPFTLKPVSLLPLGTEAEQRYGAGAMLSGLEKAPYALCTAVGTPESVGQSATEFIGYAPQAEFIYPDHYKFTPEDVRKMAEQPLPLVVTAKDAVKLLPLLQYAGSPQCFVLESIIQFGPALFTAQTFAEWFAGRYNSLR